MSWWSMVLYGMIAYALLSAIVVGFWGIRALRFKQFEVAGGNLQPTLCRWLEDSGLRTKTASDPAWEFGLLTTLSDGEPIYIVQMKEHPRFVTFQANLVIPAEHQAILKAMPGRYFEQLAQEVVLKVFLAKMVLAIRTRLSEVSLFSQLAIQRPDGRRVFQAPGRYGQRHPAGPQHGFAGRGTRAAVSQSARYACGRSSLRTYRSGKIVAGHCQVGLLPLKHYWVPGDISCKVQGIHWTRIVVPVSGYPLPMQVHGKDG